MTWVVESEYGRVVEYTDLDPFVIVRSWAETYVAAWWVKPGQGVVFANVPAEQVWLTRVKEASDG